MTDQPQGRQLQPPRVRVPEPRKPKTQGFVRPSAPVEHGINATEAAPEAAETPSVPQQRRQTASRASTTPGNSGGLRKAQIYIDATIDDYLWQIRTEAVSQRLDVGSAAVARLALHRLMAEMSPAEVVKHLATGQVREGPGRKRR